MNRPVKFFAGSNTEHLAAKIFDDRRQRSDELSQSLLANSVQPLQEQLQEFRRRVDHVYDRENAERNKLAGQIAELQGQTLKIGEDAINLARALKGDNKAQGDWGEVILERLLEESGMQKGREYDVQVALSDAEGHRRNPDVIVRLPEGRDIIIDAKVSMLDYERYCSAVDSIGADQCAKKHLASMRAHIKGLSLKSYESLEGVRSLDFVFVFVPIEAAFMLALQKDSSLFREAYERQVILVSPTTLMATLRAVESIWRYEKQNKNAEKMAVEAGGLYDQFVLLLEALDEVGRYLGKSQQAYKVACGRLSDGRGNLLRRVEKIKQQATESGLFFYGPITQKKFLFFNGINERFIKLSRGLQSKKKFEILDSQFTRLTDANGMGDLIKCVFITKKELELNFF